MVVRTFAAVVASFDVFLSVIPSTTGVGHHNCQNETGNSSTCQHTSYTNNAHDQTNDNWNNDSQNCWQNHLVQSGFGTQVNTASVVWFSSAFHQTWDGFELSTNFNNDALCSTANGFHCQSCEYEWEHSTDQKTDQDWWVHNGQVEVIIWSNQFYLIDVGSNQSQSGQSCGTNCKTFTGSSGCVTQGVQSVGSVTNFFAQTSHFSDTTSVISNRAVSVGSQSDTQSGQHTNSCQRDSVQTHVEAFCTTGYKVADQNCYTNDNSWDCSGFHTKAQTTDDQGSRTCFGSFSQMLSWFVRVGGVVFGEVTDQYTSQQTGNDSEEETDAKTGNFNQSKGSNDYQNRADVSTFSQRTKQFLLICAFFCLNKEGTDNGSEDTQSTQSHWDHHTLEAKASGNAQSHGGKSCTCIGFIQVSTHTSNVTYVVAYVVSDNCRVSRVVFWDTSFNFTNQVSTNVSSFGEDTAAYTSKQSHGGSTHTKGD